MLKMYVVLHSACPLGEDSVRAGALGRLRDATCSGGLALARGKKAEHVQPGDGCVCERGDDDFIDAFEHVFALTRSTCLSENLV